MSLTFPVSCRDMLRSIPLKMYIYFYHILKEKPLYLTYICILMSVNSKLHPSLPTRRVLIARHEDRDFNCEDVSRAEKMILVGIQKDNLRLRVLMNSRSCRPLRARGLNYLRKITVARLQSPVSNPAISI